MPIRIPRYPLLTWTTQHSPGRGSMGCVLDAEHVAFTTSGRMATALALQIIGIQAGDEVLLPAYHCPTMVHPVHWAGATPRFYRLRPDLTVDLTDLRQRICKRTRVVVAAHFFGFPAELAALRVLCDEFKLTLIEDCAHTLYGGTRNSPVGSVGDYAVSSLMKFFPITDGGCLTSRQHRVDGIPLYSGGAGFEARACINSLERSVAHGRLQSLALPLRALVLAKDTIRVALIKQPAKGVQGADAHDNRDLPHQEFMPGLVHTRMSLFSRLVLGCSAHGHSIARRRAAYARMQGAFSHLPHCRVVQKELPEGVAPYVFPLWLDEPDQAYLAMQQAGLPVMRWDQISAFANDANCDTSAAFARHLIQVPCHQALTDKELGDLIVGIQRTIVGVRHAVAER